MFHYFQVIPKSEMSQVYQKGPCWTIDPAGINRRSYLYRLIKHTAEVKERGLCFTLFCLIPPAGTQAETCTIITQYYLNCLNEV